MNLNAIAVLVAITAIACSPSEERDPEGLTAPPQPEWSPCTEQALAGADCATIEVPLDYGNPGGEAIQIALSRARASDPARRIGVVLVNPGGPGVPGRGTAVAYHDGWIATGFPEPPARFDWVGFDPRGVAASTAVGCRSVPELRSVDWTPDDDAERAALEQAVRDLGTVCEAGTGRLLGFVDSYSVARDMDQIRRALREEKINYFGTSYGTILGTAYAELFPENVRGMVLEAAVRPNLDAAAWLHERSDNWERTFRTFAADCNARSDCGPRFGGDVVAAFDAVVAQLDLAPLTDPASGETMNGSAFGIYAGQLVNQLPDSTRLLENLIESAAAGNTATVTGVLNAIDGLARIGAPMQCADRGFSDPAVVYTQLLPELGVSYPRFGHADLPLVLPCATWPTQAQSHTAPHAARAPPILVVGGTGDPSTPYWWSERLASELDSAVLIRREGPGHAAFSQCVNETEVSYLLDLTVPPDGMICPTP